MMLFLACTLTVVIETPLLWLFGHRDKTSLVIVVCVNIVTNLLLNLTLLAFPGGPGAWIYLLEALVVAVEYGVYALAFGPSRGLLLQTFVANCVSYGIGLLIF